MKLKARRKWNWRCSSTAGPEHITQGTIIGHQPLTNTQILYCIVGNSAWKRHVSMYNIPNSNVVRAESTWHAYCNMYNVHRWSELTYVLCSLFMWSEYWEHSLHFHGFETVWMLAKLRHPKAFYSKKMKHQSTAINERKAAEKNAIEEEQFWCTKWKMMAVSGWNRTQLSRHTVIWNIFAFFWCMPSVSLQKRTITHKKSKNIHKANQ